MSHHDRFTQTPLEPLLERALRTPHNPRLTVSVINALVMCGLHSIEDIAENWRELKLIRGIGAKGERYIKLRCIRFKLIEETVIVKVIVPAHRRLLEPGLGEAMRTVYREEYDQLDLMQGSGGSQP